MCSHETALPAASPFSSSKMFSETLLGVSPSSLPPSLCRQTTSFLSLVKQTLSSRAD